MHVFLTRFLQSKRCCQPLGRGVGSCRCCPTRLNLQFSRAPETAGTGRSRVLGWVLRLFGLAVDYTLPVSYTSVTRIQSAFPAITSVSNITSAIVHTYAGTVEAEINAKISKQYSLPLTADCPLLTAIATRETIYRIAVQRALIQFPPAQQGQHPMQIQHKEDQALLLAIADGEMQLLTSSMAVISPDTTQMEIYSTTKTYNPTFHEGAWTDMVQDDNKLDDIETARQGTGL